MVERRVERCSLEEFKDTYMRRSGWSFPTQLDMGIIESRLMMQGVLTEDGWAALASAGVRHAKDIWLSVEETLQSIILAAEEKLPEHFGRDKRMASFECRYNGEAYFEAGDPPRVSIDGFTILRKTGPRGTQPGSATDKRVYGLSDRRRGHVYAADLGITMHWDPNMDERTRMQVSGVPMSQGQDANRTPELPQYACSRKLHPL